MQDDLNKDSFTRESRMILTTMLSHTRSLSDILYIGSGNWYYGNFPVVCRHIIVTFSCALKTSAKSPLNIIDIIYYLSGRKFLFCSS